MLTHGESRFSVRDVLLSNVANCCRWWPWIIGDSSGEIIGVVGDRGVVVGVAGGDGGITAGAAQISCSGEPAPVPRSGRGAAMVLDLFCARCDCVCVCVCAHPQLDTSG